MNETNRHIIEADLIIPDIKAQAIIELEETQLLSEKNRQAILVSSKNPILLAKIWKTLKDYHLCDDEYQAILNYDDSIDNLLQVLLAFKDHQLNLNQHPDLLMMLLKQQNNLSVKKLGDAILTLHHFDILNETHLRILVQDTQKPIELSKALVRLHQENILTKNNLDSILKSTNKNICAQEIMHNHLIKKAAYNGMLLGFFVGGSSSILLKLFAPKFLIQLSMNLGISYPMISLALLTIGIALIMSLTCYMQQTRLNHQEEPSSILRMS